VRGLSAVVGFRLATAISIIGGAMLLLGPVRLRGPWIDDFQYHFGWTHAELITSFMLGVLAFFVGCEPEEERVRIRQALGGLVAVGAIVTYIVLIGRARPD
jgi:membrane-bound metal-dependent hydrolase YbcI (DUF457 family)